MKRITTLLFALIIATSWTVAQTSPKPVTVYAKLSGTQLTVYYDDNWCYWDDVVDSWFPNEGVVAVGDWYNDERDAGRVLVDALRRRSGGDDAETLIIDSSLANLGLPVKDASSLFTSLDNIKTIAGLENLDWSQVTNMKEMFSYCSSLESVDLSVINTKNVTDMSGLFSYCSSLKSVDLSSWNTENVIFMAGLFAGCTSLENVDLSSFNTRKVEDIRSMFYDCQSLKTLDLSNFVLIFNYCCPLKVEKP